MKEVLGLLQQIQGSYKGSGVNHEGQKFESRFAISSILDGVGAYLTFAATGSKGEAYHTEHSLIGKDFQGNISLFVLSNNHPGLTPHPLKKIEETSQGTKKIIFGFGNVDEGNTFREEIILEIYPDNKIDYRYFWGLPKGEFAERSGATMTLFQETK